MKITKEDVSNWAGQNPTDFLLEVLTELVNGKYGVQDVKDNIVAYRDDAGSDDTYDEYGVNTKNSFNTPKGESK